MWRVIFTPDAQHRKHRHMNSDELFYLIRGHFVSSVDGKEYVLGPGDCHFIPKGVIHYARALTKDERISRGLPEAGPIMVEAVGVYTNAGGLEESGYVFEGEITIVMFRPFGEYPTHHHRAR